jgi:hypothetical protein
MVLFYGVGATKYGKKNNFTPTTQLFPQQSCYHCNNLKKPFQILKFIHPMARTMHLHRPILFFGCRLAHTWRERARNCLS